MPPTGVNKKKRLPDGLKVNQDGNLFATGPGGVLIFAPDGVTRFVGDPGCSAYGWVMGSDNNSWSKT